MTDRPWPVQPLDEGGYVSAGQSAPQDPSYFGGNNRFVRVSHLDVESASVVSFDLITDSAVSDLRLRLYPKGTIVFPKSGASVMLEKRAMLPFDAYLVSHLAAVQPDTAKVDPWYLFMSLRQLRFAEGMTDGYPTIKLSEIRATKIPVPPLPEQRAIAHVLRTVQQAREATEQVIDAARELKRSLMRHLFSGDWHLSPLDDVADVVVSTSSLTQIEARSAEGAEGTERVLYLKVSDLARTKGARWIEEAAADYDKVFTADLKLVPQNSTIFPKRGAAISTNRKRQNRHLAALDPNLVAVVPDSVRADYLFRWFEQFDLKQLVPADVIPQINKKDIAPLLIPVPDDERQAHIAAALDTIDLKIMAEEQRRDALETLFTPLLSELMSGKRPVPESVVSGA